MPSLVRGNSSCWSQVLYDFQWAFTWGTNTFTVCVHSEVYPLLSSSDFLVTNIPVLLLPSPWLYIYIYPHIPISRLDTVDNEICCSVFCSVDGFFLHHYHSGLPLSRAVMCICPLLDGTSISFRPIYKTSLTFFLHGQLLVRNTSGYHRLGLKKRRQ